MNLGPPYQGYTYAYPHKTAYRPLAPRPLEDVWAGEDTRRLFLYLHVPFCEMRCGFCNLFTTVGGTREQARAWLGAVERHVEAVQRIGGRYATAAIGGGTPTWLEPEELAQALGLLSRLADLRAIPWGFETSPHTATPERLRLLRDAGAERASIGVQSFLEAEAHAAGRPQKAREVDAALDALRTAGFPTLNLDLIYGIPGQTPETLTHSIRRALAVAPEEVFLYPLYVREGTGLGRTGVGATDAREALYRTGRDLLLDAGYTQHSMRMFRHGPGPQSAYRCQVDGMVGIGAGARSYTTRLHYASEWGVGSGRVRQILAEYVARPDHGVVDYGFELSLDEQMRRHVLQSLLQAEGLDVAWFRQRFGAEAVAVFPLLGELVEAGLAEEDGDRLRLTAGGLARSDAIGPALYSAEVRERMEAFDLR